VDARRRAGGEGILIRGGGLREIRAGGEGVLTEFRVRVNDTVAADQVIGEIAQQDIEERVRIARVKLEEAQREYDAARAEDEATIAGTRATIAGHRAEIERLQAQLDKTNDDLAQKRVSLEKGLVTRARVQAIEREVLSLQASINTLRATINSLQASIRGVEQRIRARAATVEAARLELERLTTSAAAATQVRSTVAGRVVEVKRAVGDRVRLNEVLAVVEPPSAVLEPVVYVNSEVGKRIKPGMEAQVSPSTVKREEYGFMKGDVRSVGEYPVTPEAVLAVVANAALATELLGNTAKLEVRVALRPDPKTPSGFAWSSSTGPPFRIDSGTRVTVSIVVDRRAPVTYVLPAIRGALGAS
jgi:HlyD family secretion protein